MRDELAVVGPARSEGVVVLVLSGALGVDQLQELDAAIATHAADDVVIDLTSCTLASASAVDALDPPRWDRPSGSICVACRRPSARELIARAGVARRMAVFQCVEDALQCHVMWVAGFGSGWMPAPAFRAITSLDEYRELPAAHAHGASRSEFLRRADASASGSAGVELPTIAQ